MRIVVSSTGNDLDAEVSPVFGRCPVFMFVDTTNLAFEAVPNPAIAASGGAGIQAAQFAVSRGAQAVLSGNLGPNASQVFQSAGVPLYMVSGGTVRQAVAAFNAGQLQPVSGATVGAHTGMGRGRGLGLGRGRGGGATGWVDPTPAAVAPGPSPAGEPASASPEDLAALKEEIQQMQQQLANLLKRLGQ